VVLTSPEKETNYKNIHQSPSDDNRHVSVFRADQGHGDDVGRHAYPDGSFKQFVPKDNQKK
jgi:hypothetical protein